MNTTAAPLPHHSVSGLSSGADMAMIHLIVHSSVVRGAVIDGGAPYGCQILHNAEEKCQFPRESEPWRKHVAQMDEYMRKRESSGLIDPLSNLRSTKVLLYSGSNDYIVDSAVMRAVAMQLDPYVAEDGIKNVFNVPSGHAFVTDDPRAQRCDAEGDPWVNFCEGFSLAGEALRHMLGDALRPRASRDATGRMHTLRQGRFLPSGWDLDSAGLAEQALLYVPQACAGGGSCAVHVDYHPCACESFREYARTGGWHQWADSNGLLVLHPRASWDGAGFGSGCWDWDGSTGHAFDTHAGVQLATVTNMVSEISQRGIDAAVAEEEGVEAGTVESE